MYLVKNFIREIPIAYVVLTLFDVKKETGAKTALKIQDFKI